MNDYSTGGNNDILYFEARKANGGNSPGINSPFTSTIKDMSRSNNDVTLYNFSGSTTDGYCQQLIVSGTGTNKTFINLLRANGSFASDTNADGLADTCISTAASSFYNFGNTQEFTATAQNGEVGFNSIIATNGDVIYACAEVFAPSNSVQLVLGDGAEVSTSNNDWDNYTSNFLSVTKTIASSSMKLTVRDTAASGWKQIRIKNMHIFDLTQIFGAQNIPTQAQMDVIIKEVLKKYGYINSQVLQIASMNFLCTDGIDGYGVVPNNSSFYFSGGDFAISGVFITPSQLQSGYIISKCLDNNYSNTQFALYLSKDTTKGYLCLQLGTDVIKLLTVADNINPSTLYTFKVKMISNVLKCELNSVEVYSKPCNIIPQTHPNTFLFGRSADSTGSRSINSFKGYIGLLSVHGQGVDESNFDTWCNGVFSDYIAPVTLTNPQETIFDMLKVGISIGNTLDSMAVAQNAYETKVPTPSVSKEVYYETLYGNPVISQSYINMLKNRGFTTIRVPITWWNHVDVSYNINVAWLQRVKQVVDYIIDDNTYCIINLQHDCDTNGWFKADNTTMVSNGVNFAKVWTQIANYFNSYDNHLIFEGFNEILNSANQWNFAGYDSYSAANYLNQLFVNTVRSTGGNNASRYLCTNIYAASGELEVISKFVIPKDIINNKLIVQLHYYGTDLPTIHSYIDNWNQSFVQKGIPLMLGEFGTPFSAAMNTRLSYTEFVVGLCAQHDIPCIIWDDGNYNGQAGGLANYGLMDRVAMSWVYPQIADMVISSASGSFSEENILSLEPSPQKSLTLYKAQGIYGFTFSNPGCNVYRLGDTNYALFQKIDVSRLKSRNVQFIYSTGTVYLAEYDIYGNSIYVSSSYITSGTTFTLNVSTVYIQFCDTWMNDTATIKLSYISDVNLIYAY